MKNGTDIMSSAICSGGTNSPERVRVEMLRLPELRNGSLVPTSLPREQTDMVERTEPRCSGAQSDRSAAQSPDLGFVRYGAL
ncbi:hypothetical protein Ciccas_003971 [Cichlidogyrus casuarinus]|uniref:Uncharacterized protein n=1 Tax=Cichlidogyrus casuarinus TaxID=1844966 RepID=A0ABD2QG84_9PLAT